MHWPSLLTIDFVQSIPEFMPHAEALLFAGAAAALVYSTYHLFRVPVSGRLRFLWQDTNFDEETGFLATCGFVEMLEREGKYILEENHPIKRVVQGVLDRLSQNQIDTLRAMLPKARAAFEQNRDFAPIDQAE
jgi:hypothetical protein